MKRILGAMTLSLATVLVACEVDLPEPEEMAEPAEAPACDPDDGGLQLAEGFCGLEVADDLGRARHLAVASNGDLFVRLRSPEPGGAIVALRDENGDGRADRAEYFRNDDGGTGIAVREGHLYFSTDTEVSRVPLPTDGSLVPTAEPELVAGGFPDQRSHAAKSFTFDDRGNLYVNVGSPTNSCQPIPRDREVGVPGQDPCPEYERQTGVWRFSADAVGQMQEPDGTNHAVGIRNSVALAWSPAANGLYNVQHGRDLLDRLAPEHYDAEDNAELPAEEMHRLEEGDTLAYPYCYYDHFRESFILAPEYGGQKEPDERCEEFKEPLATYPAHFAPNDLHFYTGELFPQRYRDGAFIAFHGSWNRTPLPQRGYKVVFQPMDDGEPSGEWEVFADGFAEVDRISSPDDAEHRPMGLTQGPDGGLYISDSVRGKVWKVVPDGS